MLRRHAAVTEVRDDGTDHVHATATSSSYVRDGKKAKTSPVVFLPHRSNMDDRRAISEMLNVAGDRRELGIIVGNNLVVRNHFEALQDDIDITYMSDALLPPLPPPVGPLETMT